MFQNLGVVNQLNAAVFKRQLANIYSINCNKKVSYCKQIARQHSWSTWLKFSSHLAIYSLIIKQNLVVVSHIVCEHVYIRGSKNLEDAGARPLGMGNVGDP